MRISDWSSDVCSSDLIAGWRTPGEKLVAASIIEHRLGMSSATHRPSEREKTLLMLFRNAAAVVIATMTVLIVLSQIGINIGRSEEHTSELQSLMRISYAVFCLKKKTPTKQYNS